MEIMITPETKQKYETVEFNSSVITLYWPQIDCCVHLPLQHYNVCFKFIQYTSLRHAIFISYYYR